MALPPKYAISLYAGDDAPFIIRYKDDSGALIDLTGYTALMDFKSSPCDDAVISIAGVIAAPTSGEIVFLISGVEKSGLIVDCQTTCYVYDVELTQPGGDIITIMRGTVRIVEDVTE